jgi:hypothetical protein
MKKYYEMIANRLESKRKELAYKQEVFLATCNNEINTSCFERNAINELLVMQQLKSEIKELEYQEIVFRSQIKK